MSLSGEPRASRSLACLLYASALLLPGLLIAQSDSESASPDQEPAPRSTHNKPVRQASVVQADRLIDRMIDGEPITDLWGNVFIDRDTVTARSDTARYWRQREVYEMWGRVRLRQQETRLFCERAIYRRLVEAADFFGAVRVEEGDVIGTSEKGESRQGGTLLRLIGSARLVSPDYTVWADTITRNRETEEGEASGHVKIVDPNAQTLVTGDHAVFAADGKSARVDRNPSLTSREQGQVPFMSWAQVMHFYQDEQRVIMVDSVQIRQGATEAVADTAIFLGRETLILRGNPQVWVANQSTMVGDKIEFWYRNQQLRRIFLYDRARMEDSAPDSLAAIYQGLPDMDVLEGDTITVEIENGQVERSVVVGHAHSLYVPTDLEDEVAFNDVNGDTIILDFKDDRVDRVFVQGKMSGNYTFARLANMERAKSPLLPASVTPDTQVTTPPDTLLTTQVILPDTTATDTVRVSTLPQRFDFQSGAERVDYSGHEVEFRLAKRQIEIKQNASLSYGTMTLTADKVKFDTIERELYADGDPLLVDSEQKLVGDMMGYNFDHKSGAVFHGVTSFEDRYYAGKDIKRFEDGSLKIKSGYMTSCDLEQPHYHFWSHKMKLQLDDKAVAKPVVMYIGKVPVFALPFYFKSMKRGRRSGILFPNFNFGWTAREGRYIRDFGYYWATNEYFDFIIQADFNERRDWSIRLSNRYVKRYNFRGGFQYTRKESLDDETDLKEWQFRWNHDQDTLFDVYSLRANVQLSSQTLTTNDLSRDLGRDIVSGQLRSALTLSRRLSFVNSNLSLSRDQRVNARDDDPATNNVLYTQFVPEVSLGFQRLTLKGQLSPGQKGSFFGNLLRDTYFNQSYSFKSTQQKRELTNTTTYDGSGRWSLDVRPPRLGIFNLSARASAGQAWTRAQDTGQIYMGTDSTYVDPDSTLVLEDVFAPLDSRTEDTRPSLSTGMSLNTTLYGVFPLSIGKLRALRHTFRFSAGYAWSPSLGEKQRKSESISFSVGNRFDVKYLSGSASDSTAEMSKLDGMLDWALNTSYNPDALDGKFWSIVRSGITIRPGQSRNLSVKVDNSIDPYLWKVLDTRVNYGFNISGRFDSGSDVESIEPKVNSAIDRLGVVPDSTKSVEGLIPEDEEYDSVFDDNENLFAGFEQDRRGRDEKDPTQGGRFIPWSLNASLSLTRNHVTGNSTSRTNISVNTQLSRKWDFRYRASFDLDRGEVTRQEYTLYRDLHCWRLEFSRIISDLDSQYGFRIYLVDIPAIKLNQGNEQLLGALGGGTGSIY